MAETYCGKNCADCKKKSELKCPGCRLGPGKPYGGDCAIAKCCISRGRHDCADCTASTTCATLKGSASAAENRLMKQAREKAELIRRTQSSGVLAKWLTILFWLVIGSIVVKTVMEFLGGLLSPPVIELITLAVAAAQALVLIRLSSESYCFKMAGTFSLIYLIVELVGTIFDNEGVALVFTLAALVLSIIAAYQEFMGYTEVTAEFNEKLSHKWSTLWIVNFVGLCAMGISALLMLINISLGSLVLLLSMIAAIVISVIKLVFLWDTIKTMRLYYEETQYFE